MRLEPVGDLSFLSGRGPTRPPDMHLLPPIRGIRTRPKPYDLSARTEHSEGHTLRIGLFIPCYIDSFFPEVGIATLELLERFGCHVLSAQSDLLWTADGEHSADMEAETQVHAAEALRNGLQVQVRT
jgi:hypothetical protein